MKISRKYFLHSNQINSEKMIRNTLICALNNRNSFLNKNMATVATSKEKWDLFAGVLVERLPILSRTLKPIQKEFQTMLNEIEFEKSLKSDHEMCLQREKLQMELLKRGEIEPDLDASKQTAQDMEDTYIEELAKFETAPRLTEADTKNDKKSVNRKLEETLFLLVEQKLGDQKHFVLPQGKRTDGESMRQTAERVLQEQCGEKLEAVFYGNAPCGFYKYKYPANQRAETVGAKVFFFRSALKKAEVDSNQCQWLDKAELKKELKESYYQSVAKFLL